jgi:hypothetical protein
MEAPNVAPRSGAIDRISISNTPAGIKIAVACAIARKPSGSGAKVRHGMWGQRYARLNLDLHAMTEAPESQTHVVDRVKCVLRHATNHNAGALPLKPGRFSLYYMSTGDRPRIISGCRLL